MEIFIYCCICSFPVSFFVFAIILLHFLDKRNTNFNRYTALIKGKKTK